MSNLDIVAAHQFWKTYDDSMIYRVIAFMETVEIFTLDGDPVFEEVLMRLSDGLTNLTNFELGKEHEFVVLCSHMKTSRILRLLQTIDTIDPGSASKLLMYAEENNTPDQPMTGLFLRRNIVFERLRLLARVFSADRLEMVLNLLEE